MVRLLRGLLGCCIGEPGVPFVVPGPEEGIGQALRQSPNQPGSVSQATRNRAGIS
jgi:hypothetical protein